MSYIVSCEHKETKTKVYFKVKDSQFSFVKTKKAATRFPKNVALNFKEQFADPKLSLSIIKINDGYEKEDQIIDRCPYCNSKKGYKVIYKISREAKSKWDAAYELRFNPLQRRPDVVVDEEFAKYCICLNCGVKIPISRLAVFNK